MVRLRLPLAAVVLTAGLWATPGQAGAIVFTGNVEKDFPLTAAEGLRGIVIDNPTPGPPGAMPVSNPRDVNIPDWMAAEGRETGWNIKDIRLAYDQATDSLAVGVNFFGIAGDVDGSGDPNSSDPRTISSGGRDEPRFSNGETIAVGIDLNNDRVPDIVAGIPLVKPAGPDGQKLDGIASFTLARYVDQAGGLPLGFGASLASYLGQKAIETSLESPDIEFEIKDFSQLGAMFRPGFDPLEHAIGLEAFAAGLDDVIVGEEYVPYQAVLPQVIIPEPTTLLAWLTVAGTAAWRVRGRRVSRTV